MGSFSRPLTATYFPKRNEWFVEKDFIYNDSKGRRWYVPSGWMTDLASTHKLPPLMFKVFPPNGPWNQAAVLHDFLYAAELVKRSTADWVFRNALHAIGCIPKWKVDMMYMGVRIGGGVTYKEHTYARILGLRNLIGIHDMNSFPLWNDGMPKYPDVIQTSIFTPGLI